MRNEYSDFILKTSATSISPKYIINLLGTNNQGRKAPEMRGLGFSTKDGFLGNSIQYQAPDWSLNLLDDFFFQKSTTVYQQFECVMKQQLKRHLSEQINS